MWEINTGQGNRNQSISGEAFEELVGVEVDVEASWIFSSFFGALFINFELFDQVLNHILHPLLFEFVKLEQEFPGGETSQILLEEIFEHGLIDLLCWWRQQFHELVHFRASLAT